MTAPVDLTKLTTPFGLLDPETQEALVLHGGPWEMYSTAGNGWITEVIPAFFVGATYRVKPAPPKPREWWISGGSCLWDDYTDAYNACDFGEKLIKVREVTDDE